MACLQVAEWVSFRHKALTPLMDAGLAELNATLAGRTYIAGGRQPSLADLALYAAVSPAAVAFPVAQHGHFCNLLRWWVREGQGGRRSRSEQGTAGGWQAGRPGCASQVRLLWSGRAAACPRRVVHPVLLHSVPPLPQV